MVVPSPALVLLVISILVVLAVFGQARTFSVERGDDLQAVLSFAEDGDTVLLGAKRFSAVRTAFAEPVCGNCDEARTTVQASFGFRIRDKGLVVIGQSRDSTILVTNAGYGLFLDGADGTEIHNLTITGGKRNDDGRATDGGIVVRQAQVTI
ncbi:hypothetical protein GF377_10090, partial [candidate division GN15 bacterium]|nr:hypothetical protein [candidate division GN15 bacterium]